MIELIRQKPFTTQGDRPFDLDIWMNYLSGPYVNNKASLIDDRKPWFAVLIQRKKPGAAQHSMAQPVLFIIL